ncbi:MAG: BatB protein [Deltaproteobacteria bacterium]|nr:MAG: BatB protein [Deltaproteobacteria bacterium]
MILFAWPWAVLLLPLPLLSRWLLPPARAAEEAALWVPRLELFSGLETRQGQRLRSLWYTGLASCCWLLLVFAAMRPQWLGEPLALPVNGRNLQLAVDLSGSMKMVDFVTGRRQVARLEALKEVAIPFINRRHGDRVGLILFGDQAYVQAPLTFDLKMVVQLLQEAAVGLAGEKTAIGDAIGLALKRAAGESGQRVLILLTDGANTAGVLSPLKAAELAARQGLKIYTIGIGSDLLQVKGLFINRAVNPAADLDEEPLARIAELTGGRYFRAHDSDELKEIYAELDRLEPVEQEPELYRPLTALYPWPLGLALAGAVVLVVLELRRGTWKQA